MVGVDSQEPKIPERSAAERLRQEPDEPTSPELEDHQVVDLPAREALSIVNPSMELPVGTIAAAGLL